MRAPIETGTITGHLGTALLVHLDKGYEIRAVGSPTNRSLANLAPGDRVVVALPRSPHGTGHIMRLGRGK